MMKNQSKICQQPRRVAGVPRNSSLRRCLSLVLCVGFLASASSNSFAQQPVQVQALAVLEQRSGAPLEVSRSPLTGIPTYISTRVGYPIAVAVSPLAPPAVRASAFLDMAAPALGLANSKDVEWLATEGPDEVAIEHVRYRQTYKQIPVASAELIVHLRGTSVSSFNGHMLPGILLATTPKLGADQAKSIASRSADKARKDRGSYNAPVVLSEPRLEVLNVGFYERRQLTENHLAWFIEATGPAFRNFIWINAHDGRVLLQFSQLTDARNRLVHTANGGSSLPGALVRSEGQGVSGDVDVDGAYDYSGDTYDYYFGEHARDGYNNAGATLSSTVDWCHVGLCGSCPCQNAFWDGTQMVYGDGFSAADDVVAHELTHAVTEYSANLVYCLQSGALNESFSDIFGETVDLTNTGGTDTAGVRWLMGEDIPGFGAIRDMQDPTTFNDPGKVSDPQYRCERDCAAFNDNGGVHSNSGVPNHAFALMVDGGSYNGFSITGIGLTKAGKIQYRALTQYLTPNAVFLDDYNALNQSCQDLVGTGGITVADCAEVMESLQAVEMNGSICGVAVCGNGIQEPGEECDDSNTGNCDGCDEDCTITGCGNGVIACGEECDDGNTTGDDGCEADCTLSEGCAFYRASDVPQNIPDLGSIASTINVPVSSRVSDVNIVNLQGAHTWVGDLEFQLASPLGTAVTVMENRCGSERDFDLGLDDEASTPIPCPPTDGLNHTPASLLSAFDGQSSSGNWVLTIADQAGPDVGTLDSWGLLICSTPCGNALSDPGEECDDGNYEDTDGCTNHCTSCGNGTTTLPEECDDGDLQNGDGCDSNCTVTVCGNGVTTPPEECDDGNSNDADLCRNDCTSMPGLVCPNNPFLNCSFETGNFAGWEVQDLSAPFVSLQVGGSGFSPGFGLFTSAPLHGIVAALTGFDGDGPGTIVIAQDVRLPANATTLVFDYRAGWDLVTFGGGTVPRTFEVAIQDPVSHADLQRATVLVANPATMVLDTGDLSGSLSIAGFAGQSVRVSFEWNVPEYFAGPAFFQFDDVKILPTKKLLTCRAKVAKATSQYFRARMKALVACEIQKLQKKPDAPVNCVTDTDVEANSATAKGALDAGIDAKCGGANKVCGDTGDFGGAEIGFQATCPETIAGETCTVGIDPSSCAGVAPCTRCASIATVNATAKHLFGALNPGTDPKSKDKTNKALNKCQQAFVKAVSVFAQAKSKALQTCWAAVTKPKSTTYGLCPEADGKAGDKIRSAQNKLIVSIRKACAGADKAFGGSGANTDFLPSEIGFAATCAPVHPIADEPAFDGAILTLMDVVTCAARVTGYEVDCADRAAVPWLETYPAECLQ